MAVAPRRSTKKEAAGNRLRSLYQYPVWIVKMKIEPRGRYEPYDLEDRDCERVTIQEYQWTAWKFYDRCDSRGLGSWSPTRRYWLIVLG
jgi:hypothetical protein